MGRKPKEPITGVVTDYFEDPLDFLRAAMNHQELDFPLRIAAAKSLAPFIHKIEKVQNYKGKREVEQEQAVYVQSKFSTFQAPNMVKKDSE